MSCWLASAGSMRSTGSPLSRITQNTTTVMPMRMSAVCATRRPTYHHGTITATGYWFRNSTARSRWSDRIGSQARLFSSPSEARSW